MLRRPVKNAVKAADAGVTLHGYGPLRGRVPPRLDWQGGTLRDLLRAVAEAAPQSGPLLSECAVVVEGKLVDRDQSVRAGARLDLLPPVSGG